MPTRHFYIVGGGELRRIANALREQDAALPGRLRGKLRTAARPIVADVKLAATALPARGNKHTGLRGRLARGVGMRVSLGPNAGMRIITSMPDADEAGIPRGFDSATGWRHPVFGNTDNWVRQSGGSWFRETIAEDREFLQDRIVEVIEEARDQIDQAGTPGPL